MLEGRVLLADGINPAPGPKLLGSPGVAFSDVTVATFTIADSSGSPGTKWNAHIDWGDGNSSSRIPATAEPDGSFAFLSGHTFSAAGTYIITVMIAVPGSQKPDDNTVTTQAVVTSAALESISVAPQGATVAAGLSQPFTATGSFSDNSTLDLTDFAVWRSEEPSVATVSNNTLGGQGQATGVATGTAGIDASLAGITGSTVLTVTPAVLESISVTPQDAHIPNGESGQFAAMGMYSDQSTSDLTDQVTWSSDTPSVATISNASGAQGRALAVATGTSTIAAALDGLTASTLLTVDPAALVSITVSPTNVSVPKGTTEAFTATGNYSDGSAQDLTSQVSWQSATPSVATVSNAAGSHGLATALSTGTASISATLLGQSGSAVLTVNAAVLVSISVMPSQTSITAGTTGQFVANGTFSDGSTQNLGGLVSWNSADSAVATVSALGLATGVAPGTSVITASMSGVSGTAVLSVSAAPLVKLAGARLVFNKRHMVTQIVVTLTGPVDSHEAVMTALYRLATPGKRGSFAARNAGRIALRSASYDGLHDTITLKPRKLFSLAKPVQLTIVGTPPAGLQDSYGRFIDGDHDGQPGGNAVALFRGTKVTLF
jgi:hypothetical protein